MDKEQHTRQTLEQLIADAEQHYLDGMITKNERDYQIRRLRERLAKLGEK